jgi:hypothetical protein
MKILHHLEPLMHIKEKSDNIQTYGCIQVNLLFMLKPDVGIADQKEFVELVTKMMKAACDVVSQHNEENDKCPTFSNEENPADTTLFAETPEPKSLILPPEVAP